VQDTQKWQSYKKMQIVASFQQDLKFFKSDKNWQSCNFLSCLNFLRFFRLVDFKHRKLCNFASSCPIWEISKPVERLSQGAFHPHNSFKAKSPEKVLNWV
jgi:hypothetical protein